MPYSSFTNVRVLASSVLLNKDSWLGVNIADFYLILLTFRFADHNGGVFNYNDNSW